MTQRATEYKVPTRTPAVHGFLETAGRQREAPTELLQLIQEGWETKQRLEAEEAHLKAVNERICRSLQLGQAVVIPDLCRVMPCERRSALVENVEELYKVLGRRFADLVEEHVTYRPTAKLMRMAEHDAAIREALKVTVSRFARYHPLSGAS